MRTFRTAVREFWEIPLYNWGKNWENRPLPGAPRAFRAFIKLGTFSPSEVISPLRNHQFPPCESSTYSPYELTIITISIVKRSLEL